MNFFLKKIKEYLLFMLQKESVIIVSSILSVVLYDFSLQKRWLSVFKGEEAVLNVFLSGALWFFVIPFSVNLLYLRLPAFELGFKPKKKANWIKWFLLFLAVGIVWALWVSRNPVYRNYYPTLRAARTNFSALLKYEALVALNMFSWEFLCRGYLLFGLQKKFGKYALLIQLIVFTLLHRGKPEYLLSIVGGLGMGILALEAGSFIPVFLLHFGTAVLLDLFCLTF
ncbi:MAG: CPBP family intramembrane metalloprotease [Candidatus Atribacteria bacterium]|nr:CPBP family intramembrane metalloprotease [Candidatus Atribacteria bacterium]MCD6350213.1 CPBP family intramembrane metalloprotease [Candidatus Atribacteria bacterium]